MGVKRCSVMYSTSCEGTSASTAAASAWGDDCVCVCVCKGSNIIEKR